MSYLGPTPVGPACRQPGPVDMGVRLFNHPGKSCWQIDWSELSQSIEFINLLEALPVFEHVDGLELDAVGEEKFLGFEAAGAAWLPVDLQRRLRPGCRHVAHRVL